MQWRVVLTEAAQAQLGAIKDRRIQGQIVRRIEGLATDPAQQGKPMIAELAGHLTIRAVGQRYRIIYRLERETIIVVVVALGLRKDGDKRDVYAVAQRLLRQGLLAAEPTDKTPPE